MIHDSLAGAPLAGATVYAIDTGLETESDADGRSSLSEFPAGEVQVGFHHPALDVLGYLPDPFLVPNPFVDSVEASDRQGVWRMVRKEDL